MSELETLHSDISYYLINTYLNVRDYVHLFRVSKKLYALRVKYKEILDNAKKGWMHCVTNNKYESCQILLRLEENENNKYYERNYNEFIKNDKRISSLDGYKKYMIPSLFNFYLSMKIACQHGYFEIVELMFNYSRSEFTYLGSITGSEFFEKARDNLQIDVVKYFIGVDIENPVSIFSQFLCCCVGGHLDVAKIFLQMTEDADIDIIDDNICDIFYNVCDKRQFAVAKWLIEIDTAQQIKKNLKTISDSFVICCTNGDLDMAIWLIEFCLNFSKIDREDIYLTAFHKSCQYEHFEIAKWIYTISKEQKLDLDIGSISNTIFIDCCHNKYHSRIYIANFCFDNGFDFNIHNALYYCLNNKFMDLTQRLILSCYSKKQIIDLHCAEEQYFRMICLANDLKIAKWYYGYCKKIKSPIDIHALDDQAFKYACDNSNFDFANWLVKIGIETGSPIKKSTINKFGSKFLREFQI